LFSFALRGETLRIALLAFGVLRFCKPPNFAPSFVFKVDLRFSGERFIDPILAFLATVQVVKTELSKPPKTK
jgi:hypothetical protein